MSEYMVSKVFHCVIDADSDDEAEEIAEELWNTVQIPFGLNVRGEEILDIEELS